MGESTTLWVEENYLVNTLTMVVYQGKPARKFLQQEYHRSMFDHVLTVYNMIPDNENRLKLPAGKLISQKNKDFLYVMKIKKDDIHDHHLTELGKGLCMRNKKYLRRIYKIRLTSFAQKNQFVIRIDQITRMTHILNGQKWCVFIRGFKKII